jgi:hypothetical protein
MNASIPLHTLAMIALAFVTTLVLAGLLTPRSWWRRLTAANLALVAGMTWAVATALFLAFPAGVSSGSYRVAQALNLRASSATSSIRLAVVPAGTLIHATGKRSGDWWQLRARVDGKQVIGWSNSLWLRRTDEAGMHVDVREHAN